MSALRPTHYEVLGVDRSASSATIRRAYLAATLRTHPDRQRPSPPPPARAGCAPPTGAPSAPCPPSPGGSGVRTPTAGAPPPPEPTGGGARAGRHPRAGGPGRAIRRRHLHGHLPLWGDNLLGALSFRPSRTSCSARLVWRWWPPKPRRSTRAGARVWHCRWALVPLSLSFPWSGGSTFEAIRSACTGGDGHRSGCSRRGGPSVSGGGRRARGAVMATRTDTSLAAATFALSAEASAVGRGGNGGGGGGQLTRTSPYPAFSRLCLP